MAIILVLTAAEPVWDGPWPETRKNSLKFCATDSPRKSEKPRMNFVRKLLRLQNCRSPSPAEAGKVKRRSQDSGESMGMIL